MIRVALDRISFICLTSLFVVPAWLFGGVLRTTQVWLLVVALVGLTCAVSHRLLVRDDGTSEAGIPALVFALMAAIVLGAIQLVPLDAGLHETLSPQGRQWWVELTPAGDRDKFPLSVYPASTRADMALITLVLAALVLACLTVTSSARRLTICAVAAVNGAITAFFGIVQQLSWNGQLYWSVPLTMGGTPFAGYVNRNNAAGYLNMCLGLSLGLFIWSVTRYRMAMNHPLAARQRSRAFGGSRWTELLSSLDTVSLLSLATTVFITAGVFSTLSRGATIALIGAALITTIVVSRVHRGYISAISLLVVAAIGLGLAFSLGRAELLQARFATMVQENGVVPKDARLSGWLDAMGAVRQFLFTGTGIGTYRYAYEPYELRDVESWFYHAENQYVEALVEGGMGGIVLLALCITLAGWSIMRLLHRAADAETNAFGVAAVFVLASQVIHSVFDFGLYLPANAILLAVVAGGAATYARHESPRRIRARGFPRTGRWLTVAVPVLVIAAGGLALRELQSVATVEKQNRTLRRSRDLRSSAVLRDHVRQLQQARHVRCDDADYHYQLATLWVALYRAGAVAEMRDLLPTTVSEDALWALTSLNVLHYRAWQFAHSDDATKWQQLRDQRLVRECLQPAWDHLQQTRANCPLMSKAHLMLARLSPVFDPKTDFSEYTTRVLRTSPGDANNLFDVGLLEIQTGRIDEGVALWRQCLEAAPRYWDEMVAVGKQVLGPIQFYRRLLRGMPVRIVEEVKRHYLGDDDRNIRLELLVLAEEQLAEARPPASQLAYLRGTIHALRDDWLSAIADFQEAVRHEPQQIEWRYDLARSLLKANQFQQARFHARLCARMQPKNRKYRALLDQIGRERARGT